MTTASQTPAARTRAANLWPWTFVLVALLFVAIAAVYAFSTSFSYFATYDDEGTMMVTVRGYIEGHALYDDVLSYYGPVYYFYEWFLHSILSLPLTNDMTRAICIFHWLAASTLLALAAGRMSRSVLLAFFVFMQAVLHLTPLAREPGHPQEVVTLLLALSVLFAHKGLTWEWTGIALGAIGAALLFTKINVGAFFGFGLLLALLCQAPRLHSRRHWFWIALGVIGVMPVFLMRPHLDESWARAYCGQAVMAVVSAGAIGFVFRGGSQAGLTRFVQTGAGFLGMTAAFIAILVSTGTSLPALFTSLVTGPVGVGSAFSVPLKVPYSSWSGVAAALCAAMVLARRARVEGLKFILAAAQGLFGIVGTLLLVGHYNNQLGYLLPWSWLLLVRTEPDGSHGQAAFARTFLCLQAAWQGLQGYPTVGTQAVIGTVLLVPVFSLCLRDGIKVWATAPRVADFLRDLAPRTVVLFRVFLLAGLLYLFALYWCNPRSAWRYYTSVPTLGLRGAKVLRLPAEQADLYRALTEYLEKESDTFIAIPGMNSLYFWTGKAPPTYLSISEVVLLNDAQQARLVAALRQVARPRILLKDGAPFSESAGPLGHFVWRECRERGRLGQYRILEPAEPVR